MNLPRTSKWEALQLSVVLLVIQSLALPRFHPPFTAMEILATLNILAQLLLIRLRVDVSGLKAISIALLGVPLPSSSNTPVAARPRTRLCLLPTVRNIPRVSTIRKLPATASKLILAPLLQPNSLSHRLVILASRTINASHHAKIEPVKRFPWRMLKRCFLRLLVCSLLSELTSE